MKDIYELLNDVNMNTDDIERIDLSEFEKKRIYESVCKKNKCNHKSWKQVAAAVAVVCVVGASIPVTANMLARLSDNTHYNYKEEVTEELVPEMTEITTDNALDGVEIEVLSVSRYSDTVKIMCQLTFDCDIDDMMKDLDECMKIYDNIWYSKTFENSYVLVDGFDTGDDVLKDGSINQMGAPRSIIHSREGNTIVQEIQVSGFEDAESQKDYHITLGFKDITIGDEMIKGEWKYEYDVLASAYVDNEIIKESMEPIQAFITEGTYGEESYAIDSYALTPNGAIFYGTTSFVAYHTSNLLPVEEWEPEVYPHNSETVRLYAKDNLGNEYLMYPRIPGGTEAFLGYNKYEDDYLDWDEKAYEKYGDQVLDFPTEYDLYDGGAIYDELGKNYLTQWHPDATKITIVLQKKVTVWEDDNHYSDVYYETISEERTISLIGQED